MRNVFKKTIAFTVAIVMIMSSFSVLSYAATAKSNDVNSIVESGFESGKGLNSIANNLKVANDSEDFSITYLEIKNNKAYLKINNSDECKLVVAIYDENTLQMLTSNVLTVDAHDSTIEVALETDKMPDKYLAKAFLLDENNAALCDEYIDNKNTTAYEEFLAKTPDDFSGENIIYFSEDEEIIDFGVLNNDIEIQKVSSKMTFFYDKISKQYTFNNATNDIKSLTAGEIFYYPYGENSNEFLLFKVSKVSVSGNTVIVSEDENIDLKDAFLFIRIDESGDYTDVEVDETQLGEAFTTAPDSRISTYAFNEDATASFSETFNVEWPKKNDEAYKSAHVEGQLSFTLSTSVVLVYDPELFGEDYYEFKSETTFEFGLSNFEIVGKISLPDSVSKISTSPIPVGPFTLTPSIKFIFSVSASLGLSAVYKETITVSGDSTNGVKKHTDADKQIDADSHSEVEIKIGAGAELKLSLVEIVALSVSGEFGIVFKGTLEVTGKTDTVIHPCYICIYGKVNAYAKFDVSLSVVLLKDVIDYKVSFINLSVQKSLGDMHISISENGLDCGSGKCSRIMTKATFKVVGLDHDTFKNYPIEGATLTVPGGAFDADGDGEYNETYCETDSDGMAYVFLRAGEYTATIKADGYTEKTDDVKMMYTPKLETVVLSAGESGKCGDNLTWTFNKTSGVLTISGTGDMYDYRLMAEGFGTSPWCEYQFQEGWKINSIAIEYGVTSIGNHAFDGCRAHELIISNSVKRIGDYAFYNCYFDSVIIPNSVTDIEYSAFGNCKFIVDSENKNYSSDSSGVLFDKNKTMLIKCPNNIKKYNIPGSVISICDAAFSGCASLIEVSIPNNVTSIGSGAFYGCSNLISINIPKNLTVIKDNVFRQCENLKSITIPYGVTEIEFNAFTHCSGLTEITIPLSINSIGMRAFYGCDSLSNVYYSGTQSQWNSISIGFDNENLLNATIHFNNVSTASTDSAMYSRMSKMSVYSATVSDLVFEGCIPENKYMLIHVYGYYNGFDLKDENLYYIDCLSADSNGKVNISFIPKEEKDFCTTILVGDFGNGTKAEVLDSPINIRKPSVTSISYGDSIILHADLSEDLPTGWHIDWSVSNGNFDFEVSNNGTECKITPSKSGDTIFTATVYDANGKIISEDTQVMTSKAGFFDKIIAFFKKLFGLTKTIPQIYKGIF
ncbi:MAG: leucine-rich repeat protein [Clostridia bacterium]|nr:leucine-rich repeat protein [Clostridia bacterium]